MSNIVTRRRKPRQPLDRHLSETDQSDGTTYINAGIDSTCCNKRSKTVYKLTDGIVSATTKYNTRYSPATRFTDVVQQIMERGRELSGNN